MLVIDIRSLKRLVTLGSKGEGPLAPLSHVQVVRVEHGRFRNTFTQEHLELLPSIVLLRAQPFYPCGDTAVALLVSSGHGRDRRVFRLDISGRAIPAIGQYLGGPCPVSVQADLVIEPDPDGGPDDLYLVKARSPRPVPVEERLSLTLLHTVAARYISLGRSGT